MEANQVKKQSGNTEQRKDNHLDLALSSQNSHVDSRFYYEPMISVHPDLNSPWEIKLGQKTMRYPLWISSMTGGTAKTNEVNLRLAKTAARFGLGMGLGSSRIALEDTSRISDFDLRPVLGEQVPFYLNFGIAQIERMLFDKQTDAISNLAEQLHADGVIIHVNPLQEWMQPEGDRINRIPADTIEAFIDKVQLPLIVKEVGQGFGYQSLKRLLQLPLTALEFAANGGTNFSKLELMRNQLKNKHLMPFVHVGQTAGEMLELCNKLSDELQGQIRCGTLIISGGIRDFLDGYYFIRKSKLPAVYGQASGFLKYATISQAALDEYVEAQIEGLLLAKSYLTLKD